MWDLGSSKCIQILHIRKMLFNISSHTPCSYHCTIVGTDIISTLSEVLMLEIFIMNFHELIVVLMGGRSRVTCVTYEKYTMAHVPELC